MHAEYSTDGAPRYDHSDVEIFENNGVFVVKKVGPGIFIPSLKWNIPSLEKNSSAIIDEKKSNNSDVVVATGKRKRTKESQIAHQIKKTKIRFLTFFFFTNP